MYLYGISTAINLSIAIATKFNIEPVILSNVKQCDTRQQSTSSVNEALYTSDNRSGIAIAPADKSAIAKDTKSRFGAFLNFLMDNIEITANRFDVTTVIEMIPNRYNFQGC